jgi:tight adherence protein C
MTPATLAMKAASFAAIGFAAGQLVHAIARQPSRTAPTTGLRGWKRRKAIAESELWARLEPFVRWLGVRLQKVVPPGIADAVDRKLALAGDWRGMTAAELVALSLLSALVGAGVGAVLGQLTGFGPRAAIVGALLGGWRSWNELTDAARVRMETIGRRIPYFVDLLVLSVGAGLDFPGSVRRVIEKAADPNDPLVEELGILLRSLQLGHTRKSALVEFAARAPIPAVREFVATIIQAEEQGNSVADALTVLSGITRMKRSIDAEARASRAGLMMIGPLMLMMAALLAIVITPLVLKLKTVLQ